MKFILIATALNLQFMYPSQEVCNIALDMVKEQDPKAICIPAMSSLLAIVLMPRYTMIQTSRRI